MPDDQSLESSQPISDKRSDALAVFQPFAAAGYAFVPHRNKYARWLFLHLWYIPLCLLVYAILVVLVALNLSGDVAATISLVPYPPDYCRVNEVAEDCCPSNDPGEKCTFLSGRESEEVTLAVWRAYRFVRDVVILLIPILAMFTIDAWLITRFARRAPARFLGLATSGRLKIPDEGKSQPINSIEGSGRRPGWQTFGTDMDRALHSPWRFVLFAFLLIIAYVLADDIGANQIGPMGVTNLEPLLDVHKFVLLRLAPPFLVYAVTFSIVLLFVVSIYIRRLTPAFYLDILPGHGDRVGGLKRIGDLCIDMAFIVILPAILFGAWFIFGIVGHSITPLRVMTYFSLALLALLAMVTFFFPLWRVHQLMAQAKEEYQDAAARLLGPAERRLQKLLRQEPWQTEKVEEATKQVTMLQQAYPPNRPFPTWPFNFGMLFAFLASQLVPIIALIIELL